MSQELSRPEIALESLRETAVAAARAAGSILLRRFGKRPAVERATPHDIKLEVDRLCEEAIVRVIHERFPDHSILGEENGVRARGQSYLWIIDPLDGTVNYFHGIPHYGVSVACYEQAVPAAGLVGVVHAPATGDLLVGMRGRGARDGDASLRTPRVSDLSQAVVALTFGSEPETMARMSRVAEALLPRVRKVRSFGATALDMADVARGRLGALVQCSVRTWDIAAARIILEEAGGVVDALEFAPGRWDLLACAPGLHGSLLPLLSRTQNADGTSP